MKGQKTGYMYIKGANFWVTAQKLRWIFLMHFLGVKFLISYDSVCHKTKKCLKNIPCA